MFATQIISVLFAVGSATAAVIPRQVSAGSFSITNFKITAEANSPNAIYSFAIADLSATPSNFSTTCYASTPSSPGLANFGTTLCSNPSVSFDFNNNGTGYAMNIAHQWGETVQHAIVVAHDDFTDSVELFFDNDRLINGQTVPGGPFLAKIDAEPSFTVSFSRYA